MKWLDKLVHWIRCLISEEYRNTWHMDAAEYNKWLRDRLHERRNAVCKRLEGTLPRAWSDYGAKCKMREEVVTRYFCIYPGEYGLSSEDVWDFIGHSRVVGEYHVSGQFNPYTGHYFLSVTAPRIY